MADVATHNKEKEGTAVRPAKLEKSVAAELDRTGCNVPILCFLTEKSQVYLKHGLERAHVGTLLETNLVLRRTTWIFVQSPRLLVKQ